MAETGDVESAENEIHNINPIKTRVSKASSMEDVWSQHTMSNSIAISLKDLAKDYDALVEELQEHVIKTKNIDYQIIAVLNYLYLKQIENYEALNKRIEKLEKKK